MSLAQFLEPEEFMKKSVLEKNPEADLREGSSHFETYILPISPLIQGITDELDVINETNNIPKLEAKIISGEDVDDELNSKCSDFFLTRREGGKATGFVRVYFSAPRTITIEKNTEFRSINNLSYFNNNAISIDSAQMSLNFDAVDNSYFVDVLVEAAETGGDYVANKGDINEIIGVDNVLRVSNQNNFSETGVTTRESNSEFLDRIKQSIGARNLLEPSSARNILLENFSNISSVLALKGTSEFSFRSKMRVIDPEFITNPNSFITSSKTSFSIDDFASLLEVGSKIVNTPNKIDYFCKNNFLSSKEVVVDLTKEQIRGNLVNVIKAEEKSVAKGTVRIFFTPGFTSGQLVTTGPVNGGIIIQSLASQNFVLKDPDDSIYYKIDSITNISKTVDSTTSLFVDTTNVAGDRYYVDVPVISFDPFNPSQPAQKNIYNKSSGASLEIDVSKTTATIVNGTAGTNPSLATDIDAVEIWVGGITGGESGDRYFLKLNSHRYILQDHMIDDTRTAGLDNLLFGATKTNRFAASMFTTANAMTLKRIDVNLLEANVSDLRYWLTEAELNSVGSYTPKFGFNEYIDKGTILAPGGGVINLYFKDVELKENTKYFLVLSSRTTNIKIKISSDNLSGSGETDKEISRILGEGINETAATPLLTHVVTSTSKVYPDLDDWSPEQVGYGTSVPVSFSIDIFNTIIDKPIIGLKQVSEVSPGTEEGDVSGESTKSFEIIKDTNSGIGLVDYLPVDSFFELPNASTILFPSPSAFTFSMRNDMHLSFPKFDTDDQPNSPFNIKILKIEYYTGNGFDTIQTFLESEDNASSSADPLTFHYWPVFIDGNIFYEGVETEESVVAYVKDKINKNLATDIGKLVKDMQNDLDITFIDMPMFLIGEAHFPNGFKSQARIKNKFPCTYTTQTLIARNIISTRINV